MYISPSTLKEIHRRCGGKYPSDEESMNKWIESIIEMNTTAEPEKIYFLRDLDYLVDELHISNYKDNVGSIVRGWKESSFFTLLRRRLWKSRQ